MLIDWFTVAAQAVNFIILVYLLKRFLFDRIVEAMDSREEDIASRLNDAEEKQAQAQKQYEEYRDKNEDIENRKQEIYSEARREADDKKKELMSKARSEVESARNNWIEGLRDEKNNFLIELKKLIGNNTVDATRKCLSEMADAELEDRAVGVFIDRLRTLDRAKLDELADAAGDGAGVTVLTAFDATSSQKQKINDAVGGNLGTEPGINYETDRELVAGIALKARGKKVSWNVSDYLANLEEQLASVISDDNAVSGKSGGGSGEDQK